MPRKKIEACNLVELTLDSLPGPPAWLSPTAKKLFKKKLPLLVQNQIVGSAELEMFGVWCETYSDLILFSSLLDSAIKNMDDEGVIKMSERKLKCLHQFSNLSSKLGLTSIDRSKAKIQTPKEEGDEMEGLIS